jgi:hypothetical protein
LVALLAIDWYFDTSFGHSPFEAPLSSTQAFCHSLVHKQQVFKKLEAADLIEATALVGASDQMLPALLLVRESAVRFLVSGSDLAYVFMSIQC